MECANCYCCWKAVMNCAALALHCMCLAPAPQLACHALPPPPVECRFSDYVQSESGLQYYDIREGSGAAPQQGQTCVVDWAGVTIGYYGAQALCFGRRGVTAGGGGWVG